jgi:hypothetical protein
MILHVLEAKYLHDYVIWLRFNDGSTGEVDLHRELEGEVFGSLQDVGEFKRFSVVPGLNTVVWDNGADFAPEFLHDRLRVLT